MRLRVKIEPAGGRAVLDVSHMEMLRGLIYSTMDQKLARKIHDVGYRVPGQNVRGSRVFRMFVFGRLEGRRSLLKNSGPPKVEYRGEMDLAIASADEQVVESLATNFLNEGEIRIGHNHCSVKELGIEPEPTIEGDTWAVDALSPVTCYSTMTMGTGTKKTYYYVPSEEEWSQMLVDNLRRKALALGWQGSEGSVKEDLKEAYIIPRWVRSKDQKVIELKDGLVVKGWMGRFEVGGMPPAYLKLALDTGLGSKNPLGFGMVELVGGKG